MIDDIMRRIGGSAAQLSDEERANAVLALLANGGLDQERANEVLALLAKGRSV